MPQQCEGAGRTTIAFEPTTLQRGRKDAVTRARRWSRKHRVALVAVCLFDVILFFPTLFMGRLLGPNDVFYNHAPWSFQKPAPVQNSFLDAEATGVLAVISLIGEPGAFHWNPYIGSGVPGWGASSVLSPFFLLPGLLPSAFVYSAIILLKFHFAFLFAYLWLRQERMGRAGAAAGAIVLAAAGSYSMWWLRHPSNATALFPAILFVISRVFSGRRVPPLFTAVIVFCAAVAGFPAMVAYIGYLAAAYGVWLWMRTRHPAVPRGVLQASIASILALVVAAPAVVPFLRFVQRTGYVQMRTTFGSTEFYPLSHFQAFVDPQYLGNPADHRWVGDPALGYSNEMIEASVFVGVLTLPLALAGLFRRRSRQRFFFLAVILILLVILFTKSRLGIPFALLPGIKYSPLVRLRVLLPPALAYLAASGVALLSSRMRRSPVRPWIAGSAAAVIAIELALFAGSFFPFLPWKRAGVPGSPSLAKLQSDKDLFRIAPFFSFLYPNTSSLFRIEDIRSHFDSEKEYRALLLRIDPTVFDSPTLLMFNGLKTDVTDPLLGFLNVRYLFEQPDIDIMRWGILAHTYPLAPAAGTVPLTPGQVLERTVLRGADPMTAIEIPFLLETAAQGEGSGLVVSVLRAGSREEISRRFLTATELRRMPRVYAAAPEDAAFVVRLESRAIAASLELAADRSYLYRRVDWPVIIEHEWDDARVLRNLRELPRFYPVWNLEKMTAQQFLSSKNTALAVTAVIDEVLPEEQEIEAVPQPLRKAIAQVTSSRADRRVVRTSASVPMLLASSEKVTPELSVEVDGRVVKPVVINTMFAAVPLSPGDHRIVYRRRIGSPVLWSAAALALVLLGLQSWIERRRRAAL